MILPGDSRAGLSLDANIDPADVRHIFINLRFPGVMRYFGAAMKNIRTMPAGANNRLPSNDKTLLSSQAA